MNSAKFITRAIYRFLMVICLWATTLCVPVAAQRSAAELTDSLREVLKSAKSAADSIPVLYNIFDLSPYDSRLANARELHDVAVRARNTDVQLDMLRYWANIAASMGSDSLANEALRLVNDIPESENQRQTRTFVRACVTSSRRLVTESERKAQIQKLLTELNNDEDTLNTYDEIANLFALTSALGGVTSGKLLSQYFDHLAEIIQSLPHTESYALRNKLYTNAAIAYQRNDEPEKSLEADRALLKIIDDMKREYTARGRIYKNFDIQRYVILRRMSRNYKSLTVEELDSINDIARKLADRNPDINTSYYHSMPSIQAVTLVKHGKYAEALPLVKQLADSAVDLYSKRYYLSMLRDVADLASNPEVKQETSDAYISSLEEFIAFKTDERARELQIIHDINTIKRRSAASELVRQRKLAFAAISAAIVLILLLIPIVILYVRFRRISRDLARANSELNTERENLIISHRDLVAARDKARQAETEKSQLLTYIGHVVLTPINTIVEYAQMIVDNTQNEKQEYLRRFVSVLEINTRMLQGIAADVHEYTLMDLHKPKLHLAPANVNKLGELAIDNIRPQVKPGIDLHFIPDPTEHPVVTTDARRIELVLMSLLSNAIKFTAEGSVTLKCEIRGDELVYSVADTGVGVPPEMARRIFDRFERLNPDVAGYGLGLPVCAMIAEVMHGSVKLDVDYPGPGARFVFTVPINKSEE